MAPAFAQIQAHITRLFETRFETALPYHSLQHTLQVTAVLKQLCEMEKVSAADTQLAAIACLFHDAGFYIDNTAHEAAGARLAAEYLGGQGLAPHAIGTVCRLINATARHAPPADVLEAIVCDADLHYLGTEDYTRQADLLRKEWEMTQSRFYTDQKWLEINQAFLEKHLFYSASAQRLFQKVKASNLLSVRQKLQSL
jgi:predicted metal-dependent HD superfamily phosphohydrolase